MLHAWQGGETQQVRKGNPSPPAGMLGTDRWAGALDNGLAVQVWAPPASGFWAPMEEGS